MNLVDALRSGMPVRRPISKHWGSNRLGYLSNTFVIDYLCGNLDRKQLLGAYSIELINVTDLLSDDWEIKGEFDDGKKNPEKP